MSNFRERGEVTHRCPPFGHGTTPCCGLVPSELPRSDRMTPNDALVTCVGSVSGDQDQ